MKEKIVKIVDKARDDYNRRQGQQLASTVMRNNSDFFGRQKSKGNRTKVKKIAYLGQTKNAKKYADYYLDLLDKYAKDDPAIYRKAVKSGQSAVASAAFWASLEKNRSI